MLKRIRLLTLMLVMVLSYSIMAQEQIELRISWWGSESRHNPTLEVIDLYEELNSHVTIIPEYQGFEGYRTKLLAQASAGDVPDVFTSIMEWYPELVSANAMADLTGKIDVSGHNPQYVEACSYDGKMYGVNLSVQADVMFQNTTLLEELGVEPLKAPYDYQDMADKFVEIYEKSGGQVYGNVDPTTDGVVRPGMQIFTYYGYSQLGYDKAFPYNDEEFTFSKEDIQDFFTYFSDLRERGGVAPVGLSSMNDHAANNLLNNRQIAYGFGRAGNFNPDMTEDTLDMVPMPLGPDGSSGEIARPGLIFNVAENSEHKEEAMKFIEWFTTSEDAAVILGNSRGTLPTTEQRQALIESDQLDENDIKVNEIVDYILNNREINLAYSGPSGTPELQDILPDIGQRLAYERLTMEAAAEMFVEEAQSLLAR